MKLKLCRFANIITPSFFRSFVVWIVIMLLLSLRVSFRSDFIFGEVVALFVYVFLSPLGHPKYIELKNDEICYISPTTLPIKRGMGFRKVNVRYSVTDITEFYLKQNKIEHIFGVAHIVFTGKTEIDAGKHTDRFSPKKVHYVYGIVVKKHKSDISSFAEALKATNNS